MCHASALRRLLEGRTPPAAPVVLYRSPAPEDSKTHIHHSQIEFISAASWAHGVDVDTCGACCAVYLARSQISAMNTHSHCSCCQHRFTKLEPQSPPHYAVLHRHQRDLGALVRCHCCSTHSHISTHSITHLSHLPISRHSQHQPAAAARQPRHRSNLPRSRSHSASHRGPQPLAVEPAASPPRL